MCKSRTHRVPPARSSLTPSASATAGRNSTTPAGPPSATATAPTSPPTPPSVPTTAMSIEDLAGLYWAYASRGWTAANTRVPTSTVDAGSTSDDNTLDFGARRSLGDVHEQLRLGRDDRPHLAQLPLQCIRSGKRQPRGLWIDQLRADTEPDRLGQHHRPDDFPGHDRPELALAISVGHPTLHLLRRLLRDQQQHHQRRIRRDDPRSRLSRQRDGRRAA